MVEELAEINPASWDKLANPPTAVFDPFVSYSFLQALEQSGCVSQQTGWMPVHLVAENPAGQLLGALPLYLKSHSLGEYVFDHGWAAAYEQAGGQYYPKLQATVPFTPVTGRRILSDELAVRNALVTAVTELTARFGASSAHLTFADAHDGAALTKAGWVQRLGLQFHFTNLGYENYTDFLDALSSRKRKALRAERKKANENTQIVTLSGAELTGEHWDAFYQFYQDTGIRKWGNPYLNREFFELIATDMRQNILMIMAKRDGRWIAGALNFIGGDCLYGRYWGCLQHHDSLHFELCYHRAIEAAIDLGLSRVEAGAQGAHKIARGYLPVITHSYHHLADVGFADAVGNFLSAEAREIQAEQIACAALSPYRKNSA
ncbi:FIG110192: hypothetical protein [hydrothermal vent metagenome]|uniref:COGs COG3146 n=1 Tax=hydrothermal vent metagenome TaxID=652676 RepID=A0A3B0REU5_9ZZZZ